MKKTIIDLMGKAVCSKWLVIANFVHGSHGVLRIYGFEELKVGPKGQPDEELILFVVNNATLVMAIQEPVGYSKVDREVEPYLRRGKPYYLNRGLNRFDIFSTTNESRFLVSRSEKTLGWSMHLSCKPEDGIADVLETPDELINHIRGLLPCIGVPRADVEEGLSELISRISGTFSIDV